jgi:hypothetical protein
MVESNLAQSISRTLGFFVHVKEDSMIEISTTAIWKWAPRIASIGSLLASMPSPALAAQDCSTYIPAINKQLTSYLATVGPRTMKNVSLDEFGNMVDPRWGRPIVKLDTYVLPDSISKKLSYRFTEAATKGVRTANGRTVCTFNYEANDGFKTEKGYANFDVEPSSKTTEVVMFVSPGEAKSGIKFTPEGFAQMIINSAMRKSLASDPQYKGKFNVVF